MAEIFKLTGVIDIVANNALRNVKQLDLAARNLNKTILDTEKQSEKFGNRAGRISQQLAEILTSATSIVVVSKNFAEFSQRAIEFEQAMRNVNTIMRLSDRQFRDYSETIRTLANRTKVAISPAQAAAAAYEIASSGFEDTAANALILEKSLVAASAGITDAKSAADGIVGSLNAYSLSAGEAQRVSDVMFKTVELGVVTFDQLSKFLGTASPAASQAGVSFEELSAAIASATRAVGNPSKVMVGLRGLLLKLVAPSTQAREKFKELGLEVNETTLREKGLIKTLQEMWVASNKSVGVMRYLIEDARALSTALALVRNNGKEVSEMYDIMTDSAKTAGSTNRALAEQERSVAYQLKQAASSVDALSISIGNKLLPSLRPMASLIRGITETLEGMGDSGTYAATGIMTFLAAFAAAPAAMHVARPVMKRAFPTIFGAMEAQKIRRQRFEETRSALSRDTYEEKAGGDLYEKMGTPAYDPVVQYFQKLQEVSMYGGQRVYRRRKTNLGEQKKRQEEILLKRYLKAMRRPARGRGSFVEAIPQFQTEYQKAERAVEKAIKRRVSRRMLEEFPGERQVRDLLFAKRDKSPLLEDALDSNKEYLYGLKAVEKSLSNIIKNTAPGETADRIAERLQTVRSAIEKIENIVPFAETRRTYKAGQPGPAGTGRDLLSVIREKTSLIEGTVPRQQKFFADLSDARTLNQENLLRDINNILDPRQARALGLRSIESRIREILEAPSALQGTEVGEAIGKLLGEDEKIGPALEARLQEVITQGRRTNETIKFAQRSLQDLSKQRDVAVRGDVLGTSSLIEQTNTNIRNIQTNLSALRNSEIEFADVLAQDSSAREKIRGAIENYTRQLRTEQRKLTELQTSLIEKKMSVPGVQNVDALLAKTDPHEIFVSYATRLREHRREQSETIRKAQAQVAGAEAELQREIDAQLRALAPEKADKPFVELLYDEDQIESARKAAEDATQSAKSASKEASALGIESDLLAVAVDRLSKKVEGTDISGAVQDVADSLSAKKPVDVSGVAESYDNLISGLTESASEAESGIKAVQDVVEATIGPEGTVTKATEEVSTVVEKTAEKSTKKTVTAAQKYKAVYLNKIGPAFEEIFAVIENEYSDASKEAKDRYDSINAAVASFKENVLDVFSLSEAEQKDLRTAVKDQFSTTKNLLLATAEEAQQQIPNLTAQVVEDYAEALDPSKGIAGQESGKRKGKFNRLINTLLHPESQISDAQRALVQAIRDQADRLFQLGKLHKQTVSKTKLARDPQAKEQRIKAYEELLGAEVAVAEKTSELVSEAAVSSTKAADQTASVVSEASSTTQKVADQAVEFVSAEAASTKKVEEQTKAASEDISEDIKKAKSHLSEIDKAKKELIKAQKKLTYYEYTAAPEKTPVKFEYISPYERPRAPFAEEDISRAAKLRIKNAAEARRGRATFAGIDVGIRPGRGPSREEAVAGLSGVEQEVKRLEKLVEETQASATKNISADKAVAASAEALSDTVSAATAEQIAGHQAVAQAATDSAEKQIAAAEAVASATAAGPVAAPKTSLEQAKKELDIAKKIVEESERLENLEENVYGKQQVIAVDTERELAKTAKDLVSAREESHAAMMARTQAEMAATEALKASVDAEQEAKFALIEKELAYEELQEQTKQAGDSLKAYAESLAKAEEKFAAALRVEEARKALPAAQAAFESPQDMEDRAVLFGRLVDAQEELNAAQAEFVALQKKSGEAPNLLGLKQIVDKARAEFSALEETYDALFDQNIDLLGSVAEARSNVEEAQNLVKQTEKAVGEALEAPERRLQEAEKQFSEKKKIYEDLVIREKELSESLVAARQAQSETEQQIFQRPRVSAETAREFLAEKQKAYDELAKEASVSATQQIAADDSVGVSADKVAAAVSSSAEQQIADHKAVAKAAMAAAQQQIAAAAAVAASVSAGAGVAVSGAMPGAVSAIQQQRAERAERADIVMSALSERKSLLEREISVLSKQAFQEEISSLSAHRDEISANYDSLLQQQKAFTEEGAQYSQDHIDNVAKEVASVAAQRDEISSTIKELQDAMASGQIIESEAVRQRKQRITEIEGMISAGPKALLESGILESPVIAKHIDAMKGSAEDLSSYMSSVYGEMSDEAKEAFTSVSSVATESTSEIVQEVSEHYTNALSHIEDKEKLIKKAQEKLAVAEQKGKKSAEVMDKARAAHAAHTEALHALDRKEKEAEAEFAESSQAQETRKQIEEKQAEVVSLREEVERRKAEAAALPEVGTKPAKPPEAKAARLLLASRLKKAGKLETEEGFDVLEQREHETRKTLGRAEILSGTLKGKRRKQGTLLGEAQIPMSVIEAFLEEGKVLDMDTLGEDPSKFEYKHYLEATKKQQAEVIKAYSEAIGEYLQPERGTAQKKEIAETKALLSATAKAHKESLVLESARREAAQTELAAYKERKANIDKANADIRTAQKAVDAAERAAKQAQESLERARKRYVAKQTETERETAGSKKSSSIAAQKRLDSLSAEEENAALDYKGAQAELAQAIKERDKAIERANRVLAQEAKAKEIVAPQKAAADAAQAQIKDAQATEELAADRARNTLSALQDRKRSLEQVVEAHRANLAELEDSQVLVDNEQSISRLKKLRKKLRKAQANLASVTSRITEQKIKGFDMPARYDELTEEKARKKKLEDLRKREAIRRRERQSLDEAAQREESGAQELRYKAADNLRKQQYDEAAENIRQARSREREARRLRVTPTAPEATGVRTGLQFLSETERAVRAGEVLPERNLADTTENVKKFTRAMEDNEAAIDKSNKKVAEIKKSLRLMKKSLREAVQAGDVQGIERLTAAISRKEKSLIGGIVRTKELEARQLRLASATRALNKSMSGASIIASAADKSARKFSLGLGFLTDKTVAGKRSFSGWANTLTDKIRQITGSQRELLRESNFVGNGINLLTGELGKTAAEVEKTNKKLQTSFFSFDAPNIKKGLSGITNWIKTDLRRDIIGTITGGIIPGMVISGAISLLTTAYAGLQNYFENIEKDAKDTTDEIKEQHAELIKYKKTVKELNDLLKEKGPLPMPRVLEQAGFTSESLKEAQEMSENQLNNLRKMRDLSRKLIEYEQLDESKFDFSLSSSDYSATKKKMGVLVDDIREMASELGIKGEGLFNTVFKEAQRTYGSLEVLATANKQLRAAEEKSLEIGRLAAAQKKYEDDQEKAEKARQQRIDKALLSLNELGEVQGKIQKLYGEGEISAAKAVEKINELKPLGLSDQAIQAYSMMDPKTIEPDIKAAIKFYEDKVREVKQIEEDAAKENISTLEKTLQKRTEKISDAKQAELHALAIRRPDQVREGDLTEEQINIKYLQQELTTIEANKKLIKKSMEDALSSAKYTAKAKLDITEQYNNLLLAEDRKYVEASQKLDLEKKRSADRGLAEETKRNETEISLIEGSIQLMELRGEKGVAHEGKINELLDQQLRLRIALLNSQKEQQLADAKTPEQIQQIKDRTKMEISIARAQRAARGKEMLYSRLDEQADIAGLENQIREQVIQTIRFRIEELSASEDQKKANQEIVNLLNEELAIKLEILDIETKLAEAKLRAEGKDKQADLVARLGEMRKQALYRETTREINSVTKSIKEKTAAEKEAARESEDATKKKAPLPFGIYFGVEEMAKSWNEMISGPAAQDGAGGGGIAGAQPEAAKLGEATAEAEKAKATLEANPPREVLTTVPETGPNTIAGSLTTAAKAIDKAAKPAMDKDRLWFDYVSKQSPHIFGGKKYEEVFKDGFTDKKPPGMGETVTGTSPGVAVKEADKKSTAGTDTTPPKIEMEAKSMTVKVEIEMGGKIKVMDGPLSAGTMDSLASDIGLMNYLAGDFGGGPGTPPGMG